MGNQITRSSTNQPLEDKYVNENNSVRIKSSNVSQNDMMFQRINSLRSITYVKRNNSNRIVTYSQINPYVSNDDATYQNPNQTLQVAPPPEELVIEEQSCPICLHIIPLKFDSSETYVTTQCNHTFCKSCIQKVFAHAKHKDTCTIACPMCRAEINREILYIKITHRTFVDNPDLSFIKNNHTRKMILEAYNTIHKNELWGKLRNLTPNEHEGFMFSKNPEIIKIMDLVKEKSTVGHSGSSMAITMRTIQQIARFGIDSLNTYTY